MSYGLDTYLHENTDTDTVISIHSIPSLNSSMGGGGWNNY